MGRVRTSPASVAHASKSRAARRPVPRGILQIVTCDDKLSLNPETAKHEWLAAARAAMEIESAAIARAAGRLDGALIEAVELILAHPGKVMVTGIGKSGHVARKIAATL